MVARTRHAAVPDEHAATFTSSIPRHRRVFNWARTRRSSPAQEQFIDTPTREKGSWLWDGFNESQSRRWPAFGDQNLTRKSLMEFAQSQAPLLAERRDQQDLPDRAGRADINEYTEIYPEWVWQYWMHTGDRALLDAVYPVLVNLAGYVAHSIDPPTDLVTNLPATSIYYDYPIVTRLNILGVNVFRRAADVAAALGRPARGGEGSGHARRAHRAINRHLTRPDGTYVDGIDDERHQVPVSSQDANACAARLRAWCPPDRGRGGGLRSPGRAWAPPLQHRPEVLEALALTGRVADIVHILTDPDNDGWANILARGGTFTWEVWEPSDTIGDSMSHGWGSNVLVEIQRDLLGVAPTSGPATRPSP